MNALILLGAGFVSSLSAQPASMLVGISSLRPFLQSLAEDEQSEQLKDWAFFGLLSHLRARPGQVEEAFAGNMPMRYPYIRDKSAKAVAPGRLAFLNPRECVVLLPLAGARESASVGFLLDKGRLAGRPVPDKARVFGYAVAQDSSTIQITELRSVPGPEVFSEAFGYKELEIKTREDLQRFLGSISDVSLARWKGNRLVLGGRSYPWGQAGSLSLPDVAALYQAYNPGPGAGEEKKRRAAYDSMIEWQYAQAVKRDAGLRIALRRGRVTRARVLRIIRRRIPYAGLKDADPRVGFSLDPMWDYPAMAEDLRALVRKEGRFKGLTQDAALSVLVDSNSAELSALAEAILAKKDYGSLLMFQRRYEDAKSETERRFLGILQSVSLGRMFQSARYMGDIQGTSPGDILFYTDLTAKLWALDYGGLAPKDAIAGFRPMQEIKVPKSYWKDFIRLSKTRLWFGLRQESFDVRGNELSFEPVATRVYAASSDPAYPGKESKPNYQSGEFLGWWDAHYAAVAGYEPYYHKLNQIQKWGCIFTLLKAENIGALEFLRDVPVDRSLDFEAWYKGNAGNVRGRVAIPFLERRICGKNAECLDIMRSRDYPLMGRGFFISGGVTLASRKDILDKLAKSRPAAKSRSGPGRKIVVSAVSPGGRKKDAGPPSDRLTLATSERKVDYGSLTAARGKDEVELTWRKGEGAVCNEYLGALVRAQDEKRAGYKDESLFKAAPGTDKVIRLASWDRYLVKHRELPGGWIYLKLNGDEKSGGYEAVAAGTEPDSDVFSAKVVSDLQARRLAGAQGGVTIFPE